MIVAVRRPADTESTVSSLPHATSARTRTLGERRGRDALDAVPEHRHECRCRAAHAKRTLEFVDRRLRDRAPRAPRAAQSAAEDPVPSGCDPIQAREPRRHQQVREQSAAASARERVAVEQHDACDGLRRLRRDRDGDRRAERVPDEHGPVDAESPVERLDELGPVRKRVRPAPLRVAERRQVERVHAMRAAEQRRRPRARPTTAR